MAFGISSGLATHRAGTGQTSPIADALDACVPNVVLAYIVKECDLVRFRPSVGVVHWQRRVGRCPFMLSRESGNTVGHCSRN